MRVARPLNALASVGIFSLVGPPVGMVLLLLSPLPAHEMPFFLVVLAHPMTVFMGYASGIVPATAAGLLYGVSALLVVRLASTAVRHRLGMLNGALAGTLVGLSLTIAYLPSLGAQRFLAACVMAGCVCGLIAGWLFPVGRGHAAPAHSAP